MSDNVKTTPEIRFKGYTDAWVQRQSEREYRVIGDSKTYSNHADEISLMAQNWAILFFAYLNKTPPCRAF